MPIQTSCPSCQRPLRVPDALIGKAVKCPGCATVWTLDAEPPAEPPREEPPAAPQEEKADDAVRESLPASESPGVGLVGAIDGNGSALGNGALTNDSPSASRATSVRYTP